MTLVLRALRQILRLALAAFALIVLVPTAAAEAWTLSYHDPLRNPATGRPLSCPDPSVSYAPAPSTGYDLVCTSGFNPHIRATRSLCKPPQLTNVWQCTSPCVVCSTISLP